MHFDAYRFRFLADALNASGGFAPQKAATALVLSNSEALVYPTYLVKYSRELAEKFNRRNQVAVYRNFLRSTCSRYNGYLFSKSASRATNSPLYKAMLEDLDMRGNAAGIFWQDFALNAKARGSMLVLVDMTTELPDNQAEQVATRSVPYFLGIPPECIADCDVGDDGKFEWIALHDEYNERPAWKVWTKTDWRIQAPGKEGAIYDQGAHQLGECPVLIFSEQSEFPHYGEFSQIADLSLSWFNLVSSRDEILYGNAFPFLTYQLTDTEQAGDLNLTMGVSNAVIYRGERPGYVSPESTALDVLERAIDRIEKAIQEIGYHIDMTAQAEAAAALNLRFRNLSASLTSFSQRLADFERRCWWTAAKWLNLSEIPAIEWPGDYDIADVMTEIGILQNMQASAFSAEVIAKQQERIIKMQFANIDQTEFDALISAPAEHQTPTA